MICRAYLTKLMTALLTRTTGTSTSYNCHIALLKNRPSTNSSGYFSEGGEPSTTAGYTRYRYSYNITTDTTNNTVTAINNATIYFDEATADWTTGSEKLRYFALCESSEAGSNSYIAYGELLDSDGNPTEITVTTGQLPIIRKNMLKVQFGENESPKYNVNLKVTYNNGEEVVVTGTRTDLYAFPSLSTMSNYAELQVALTNAKPGSGYDLVG